MTLNVKNKSNEVVNNYTNINDAIIAFIDKNNIEVKRIYDYSIVNLNGMTHGMIFKEAKKQIEKIGRKKFCNKNDFILVTNEDIKESVSKVLSNKYQKVLLNYNLKLFRYLDIVIENAILISSAPETKNRDKYQKWDYYILILYLNNIKLIAEFDTVIRKDGEKHFRLQRIYNYLYLKNKKQVLDRSSNLN